MCVCVCVCVCARARMCVGVAGGQKKRQNLKSFVVVLFVDFSFALM